MGGQTSWTSCSARNRCRTRLVTAIVTIMLQQAKRWRRLLGAPVPRVDGLVMGDYAEDLNRRHVAGEITSAERSAAIHAHHGL